MMTSTGDSVLLQWASNKTVAPPLGLMLQVPMYVTALWCFALLSDLPPCSSTCWCCVGILMTFTSHQTETFIVVGPSIWRHTYMPIRPTQWCMSWWCLVWMVHQQQPASVGVGLTISLTCLSNHWMSCRAMSADQTVLMLLWGCWKAIFLSTWSTYLPICLCRACYYCCCVWNPFVVE